MKTIFTLLMLATMANAHAQAPTENDTVPAAGLQDLSKTTLIAANAKQWIYPNGRTPEGKITYEMAWEGIRIYQHNDGKCTQVDQKLVGVKTLQVPPGMDTIELPQFQTEETTQLCESLQIIRRKIGIAGTPKK